MFFFIAAAAFLVSFVLIIYSDNATPPTHKRVEATPIPPTPTAYTPPEKVNIFNKRRLREEYLTSQNYTELVRKATQMEQNRAKLYKNMQFYAKKSNPKVMVIPCSSLDVFERAVKDPYNKLLRQPNAIQLVDKITDEISIQHNLINAIHEWRKSENLFDSEVTKKLDTRLINLRDFISSHHLTPRYPSASMPHNPYVLISYTSRKGQAHREHRYVIDNNTLEKLRAHRRYLNTDKYKRQKERSKLTPALRERIFQRDNYTCQMCGNSRAKEPNLNLHCDHIFPIALGGLTTEDNLQTLCWKCNLAKGDKIK